MRMLWCLAVACATLAGGHNLVAQTIPVEAPAEDVSSSTLSRTEAISTVGVTWREPGLVTSSLSTRTSPPTPDVAFDSAKMMHVADIRPGMKGYGLSVFSGLEPERFEAEVIGVRHRMLAGTDIILCRLKSPYLVDLGVIAGMSGSPVYIDDKLIGAVAYGFTDVDDPLAGVTPIEEMLKVYNSTPVQPAIGPSAGADGNGLVAFNAYMKMKADPSLENLKLLAMQGSVNHPLQMHGADFGEAIADKYGLPDTFTLEPLSAPVLVSSQNAITARLAATLFPSLNVMDAGNEMAAMSVGIPSTTAVNSPGGPIADLGAFADKVSGGYALAVPFIEGDLNMAGVGTVTWRQGNRLVAFGHPMFQNGTVYFPMAAARINALIRSRTRPFKLGEPVGHIGMVREDRLPAIGGLFGQTAKMFPLTTTITDPEYLGKREFHFSIWNDRHMSPGLILTALGESIGAGGRAGGDSAALYTYSLKLDDGTSVTAANYTSDSNGTIMAILGAMSDAGILMNNPFKPVGIDSFAFDIQVTDRLRQASIESAITGKDVYRPGETATVEWILRPFRAEAVRMKYTFTVPAELPDGEYDVVISDADSRQSLERKRNPGSAELNSFDDIVRLVRENFAANRVYVSLVDNDTGVSVQGNEMPKLPGSVINLIQDTVDGEYFAPVRGNFVVDADVATTYEVSGKASTKLKVKRQP